jgi:hypothetical protein
MDILEHAIKQAGGVAKLAKLLSDDAHVVGQTTVSNWRSRGVPHAWRKVLENMHPEFQELAAAQQTPAQAAPESVAAESASTYTGHDRRHHLNPPHPDHERCAPLAATLAGGA